MSTDSEHSHGPQGAKPLPNLTESLFGPYLDQCWVTSAADGDDGSWKGGFYRGDKVAAFDPARGHYFSIALIKPGSTTRSDANFAGGRIMVVDDVGAVAPDGTIPFAPGAEVDIEMFDMFAPETSYEVETSLGNFQKGYVIDPPEPDIRRWKRFIDLMKLHPRFGAGFKKTDAIHYMRMETGSNQPKPNRARFKSRLAKPFTGLTCTLDELALGFGIDLTLPTQARAAKKPLDGETLSPEAVAELLDMLPDEYVDEHDLWITVGHAVYGATLGSEEGRDVFMDWSRQSAKFDVRKSTSATWDSFYDAKASATTLRVLVETVYGPQSKERARASQIFAGGGVFGVIDDAEEIPMPEKAKETEAKKFRKLLDEIAKTQKVPAHHTASSGSRDEHWLPTGGGLLDIGSLSASLPVAPPVMFEPFVRGGLTVIGGAPSIGKSNLSLDHALAMAAGRADLIRNGVRFQFPGDIVYISNEDDISVLQRRAAAWATYHKVDLTKMPHKLIFVRTGLFRREGESWVASCLEVLERLLAHGRSGADIAMIFVDTLGTSVTGIDEHQIKDMSPVMGFFRDIAVSLWCGVAFLHHTTKEAWARGSADATLRSIATIRGSGGITGTFTRGATLIVAPNKVELDAYPNWAGMDIVVEFMAKANDGPEGHVACYYRRVLVPVEQVSAENAAVREFRDEPVLVPFRATPFTDDLVQQDAYLAVIAAWPEPVQVVEKIANNGSPNSVQRVLGVSNSVAKTIVEALIASQKVEIENTIDKKNRVHRTLKIL